MGQAEEIENENLDGESSGLTVIYIAEGAQTNLIEVTKTEKVKLVDKRKKIEKKIKQQNKLQKRPISNQIDKETGEKIKETNSKHIVLNHKPNKTLFLSGYYKKYLPKPTTKYQFKISDKNLICHTLVLINGFEKSPYFSLRLQSNAYLNKRFTRPPPSA